MKSEEIVSATLSLLKERAIVGITTQELDEIARLYILEQGGIPYNLNYNPPWARCAFPFSVCISVNSEIGHGFPSKYKLKDGDLVSFDLSVKKDNLVADAGLTIGIGEISHEDQKILRLAKRALYAGISKVRDGCLILDIAKIIEQTVYMAGFVVNHNFVGHGIGVEMHMEPSIPSYVAPMASQEVTMKYFRKLHTGERICIEPFITKKDEHGFLDPNGWTLRTRDGNKSAFFEHMLEVTDTGCIILTNHISE